MVQLEAISSLFHPQRKGMFWATLAGVGTRQKAPEGTTTQRHWNTFVVRLRAFAKALQEI